jgi:N-acetylneuraminic acid mutarotase
VFMSKYGKVFGLLCLVLSLFVSTLIVTQDGFVFSVVNASSAKLVENSWTSKAPLSIARSGLGVVAVNGKIYAIGGVPTGGGQPSSPGSAVYAGSTPVGEITGANEEYDPATNTWTNKSAMPTPRAVFAIAVCQNKIYCIGGKIVGDYTGVVEVYDTATDTWETKTSMPTPRAFLQANVVNNKIYVIAGNRFLEHRRAYIDLHRVWLCFRSV